MYRRDLLAALPLLALGCGSSAPRGASSGPRVLGRTGREVEAISLGGEGILRSSDREDDAVAMIRSALEMGVKYCDTAPAYESSQDYYGRAFRELAGSRERVFLASKTHDRTRDGTRELIDRNLARLGTDRLDLIQLHDLRGQSDLDAIFGDGGAIEAIDEAKQAGKVRHVGITGHADPQVLLDAMSRYDFDTVLVPINPADNRRLPFLTSVVADARRRGMGVIGMKAFAKGRLLADRVATPEELLRYAATFADTVIVGCASPDEVHTALSVGRPFTPMPEDERRELEERVAPHADRYDTFKRE